MKYSMAPVCNRGGYIMRKIHPCLMAAVLLVTGGACLRTATTPERASEMSAFDGVRFRTEWTDSGTVVLTKGRYVEPAEPGSASQVVIKLSDKGAKGIVDGRETAAAVLISSGGGSGTFYDLVLVIRVLSHASPNKALSGAGRTPEDTLSNLQVCLRRQAV
jgi:hypothetical protein